MWRVRAEIDAFVAELQRDACVTQLLLGGGGGVLYADARWLVEGERRCHLHFPRFDDDRVFGVPCSFPPSPSVPLVDQRQEVVDDSGVVTAAVVNDSDTIHCSCIADVKEACSTQAPPAQAASFDQVPTDQAEDGVTDDAADVAADRLPSLQSDDDRVEAEAPANAVAEPVKASVLPADTLTVETILATHSREEIRLELEWVKQALRERRKVCWVDCCRVEYLADCTRDDASN